jgi:ankyrin repeat protein
VQALLALKADVNAKQADGGTSLMAASQNGHLDVVQALLAAKADVNARAFDEKAESIVDSHDGTNQIQRPHWYRGASHEWESLIPTICANVSLLRSKPATPVWKLPSCTTWL